MFIGEWRRAKAALAGLASGPLPDDPEARVALADAILEVQRLRADLDGAEALGSAAFGSRWDGAASDWGALAAVAAYLAPLHADVRAGRAPAGLLQALADAPDGLGLDAQLGEAERALATYERAADRAVEEVGFDPERRFGKGAALDQQPVADLLALFEGWQAEAGRLRELLRFNAHADRLAEAGLIAFVPVAERWPLAGTRLVDAFEDAWYRSLLNRATEERPPLQTFQGAIHEGVQERFRRRDQRGAGLPTATASPGPTGRRARACGAAARPGRSGCSTTSSTRSGATSPYAGCWQEAGRAVQAVKPVFMMSPLSVAAYLAPGAVRFDLVVFDEASQVKPVDAFGALLRADRAVVVGDSKQLPPTSFFDALAGDADPDDDASAAADVESVLGLFRSKRAPERMLRWHYRSRHESLIALSNYAFYDGGLVTFPSPDRDRTALGLRYHHLPDTVYDRGGTSTNRGEARAVAQAVQRHALEHPDLSLLVATFSRAQQVAVWEEVDALAREDATLGALLARADTPEPFDVKNLENVQGDERDVVFLSVGYGRDADGNVSMNFGPLNREGGERRLNVLITRARMRCEVFTNLDPDDLGASSRAGVAAFKQYLAFAKTGRLDTAVAPVRAPDSSFEQAVAAALRARGYEVEAEVGTGTYRIDLAVRDPERPGRYALGVECDGPTYASALTARDRDRIRPSVLEGLGWRLHRAWSPDWFRDPEGEAARAADAIQAGIAAAETPPAPSPPAAPDLPDDSVVPRVAAPSAPEPSAPTPYQKADVSRREMPVRDVPIRKLAGTVAAIVQQEGPIHQDELERRVVEVFGGQRVGSAIREAIAEALERAEADGRMVRRGAFWYDPEQPERAATVRSRADLPAVSRQIEYVAPEELTAAVRQVVQESYGIARDALAPEVWRRLGFAQTSADMRASTDAALRTLLAAGAVAERDGEVLPGAS